MFAGVTETAARNIEAARFGGHGRADENQNEETQDRQSTAVEKAKDQSEPAKNLQPGQIKREANAYKPWQDFKIVDVEAELDRVNRFHDARVNEEAADNYGHNSQPQLWPS